MDENIVLEVDGIHFPCKKNLLRLNSAYFDAMFSGNFKEQKENIIVIKDVSPVAMKVIINSLTENSLHIEDDELLPSLQASCMLQFDHIKEYCIETITEILSYEFCINVYFMAIQLDLQTLAKKSLCIALLNFKNVIETRAFLKLDIIQLQHYLAHPALHCDHEIDVFEAAMKWWYEHEQNANKCTHENNNVENQQITTSDNDENDYCTNILLNILNCISFKNIHDTTDINLMITYPGISKHTFIAHIFQCIYLILKGEQNISFNERIISTANELLANDGRDIPQLLCIVGVKKPSSNLAVESNMKVKITNAKSYLMFYDGGTQLQPLVPLRHVGNEDGRSLQGYRIQVWKNKFILFGGEYMYGHGNWNTTCWLYDTTKEKWSKLTKLPSVRRHFKCCIVGDELYVIGGTGQYRVVQYNMDCYNLKRDCWEKKIRFPYDFRDVECCEYKNNLFITCGGIKQIETYLYNTQNKYWTKLNICDPSKLYKKLELPDKLVPSGPRRSYVPFVYKGNIYINGNYLLGLKLNQMNLEVFYFGAGMNSHDGTLHPVGMCVIGDNVYTFKSEDCADVDDVVYNSNVQCFSIINKEIFEICELKNKDIMLTQDSGCFGLFHHSLL